MNRNANLFSRVLERENEEKQAREKQPDAPQPSDAAAIHTTDGQSARILTMPNRRAAAPSADEKAVVEIEEKNVTPENWSWSEPPKFAQKSEDGGIGAAGSVDDALTALERVKKANQSNQKSTLVAANPLDAIVEQSATNFRVAPTAPAFRTAEINPERVEPHLVAITQPRSVHCEEFRSLRTRILHASQRQKLQAIVIASGSPAEGKSTVALNLAWLLAQTDGIKALIIDADLRLPCLADYLDVTTQPGLSEVFSGTAKVEDAIVRLEPAGLHLLPGGTPRDDVAEMLSGNKFRDVLTQTRKMFDYIIVDAPSLGTFTDAAVLINQTDAALLVVRAGKTRYGVTDRLLETLPRERMLGVVLNGSQEGMTNKEHYETYYNPARRKLEAKE